MSSRTRIFRENFTSPEHISSPSTLFSSVPLFLFSSVVYLLEEWRECMKRCCRSAASGKLASCIFQTNCFCLQQSGQRQQAEQVASHPCTWSAQYPRQAHSRHVTNADSSQLAILSKHCCFVVCALCLSRSQQS